MNKIGPHGFGSNGILEGTVRHFGVGTASTSTPHTLLDPNKPITQEQARALLAENNELRQLIYHKASYDDEMQYFRMHKMAAGVSTSDIARHVESMGNGNLTGTHISSVKLPQQFIYRMLYKILDNMCAPSETDWGNKPPKLSKLKWVWQRNLLYMCPFILWSMRKTFEVCHRADPKVFKQMLQSLEQYVSKNP